MRTVYDVYNQQELDRELLAARSEDSEQWLLALDGHKPRSEESAVTSSCTAELPGIGQESQGYSYGILTCHDLPFKGSLGFNLSLTPSEVAVCDIPKQQQFRLARFS